MEILISSGGGVQLGDSENLLCLLSMEILVSSGGGVQLTS